MNAPRSFSSIRFGGPAVTPQSLGIPTAAYPGRIATNSDLIVAVDRQQTTLLLPLNAGDTTMTVLDPSMIVAYNLLSIDNEIVKTTGPPGGNVIPISRGFDGTTPVLHSANSVVAGLVDAWHHNALVAEVEAIETFLGPHGSNLPNPLVPATPTTLGGVKIGSGVNVQPDGTISMASPLVFSYQFNFPAQTPGGTLSAGNQVITLSPVPNGVNGTDTNHYLYISGGAGTAEAALITGGTAVSGAPSGTVILNCANAHSGAWTIQSATAGIFEAYTSLPANGGVVRVLASANPINIYGKMVFASPKKVMLLGDGSDFEHNSGSTPLPPLGATTLLWQGAVDGPVISFQTANNINNCYGGVMNLVVNCNGVATIGVQCLSTKYTVLENLNIMEATVADLDLNVVSGTVENSGPTGNGTGINCRNLTLTNYSTTGGQNGIGLRMGGSSSWNCAYCTFVNIRIVYSKNPGIAIYNGDSNLFEHVGLAWSGVGSPATGLLLDGSASGSVTRNNTFIDLDPSIKAPIQQNGADSTSIYGLNQINGGIAPASTLGGNSVGGYQGSLSCIGHTTIGIWTIAPAVNVQGAFTHTIVAAASGLTSITLLAANIVNAIIEFTANAPIACLTDTAAHIVGVMGNASGNLKGAGSGAGPACEWYVINAGNNTVTVTGGAGVIIQGSTTVSAGTCRTYKVMATNTTLGSEAVSLYSLGAGAL